jgi:NADPH:quinone reductase-like Zn-dependent oxidoreductase
LKAVVLHDKDQPLVWTDVDKLLVGQGEALVNIKAAAFNHRDLWIQKGQYANLRYPIILGSDGSGVVTDVGPNTSDYWVGKEVMINPGMGWGADERFHARSFKILGLPDNGTFAEFVKVPLEYLYEKPAYLTFEDAAAIPLGGLTGYRALFTRGHVKAGETVLISGIGGGVALLILQMAIAAGAKVYVTSGSDEKIEKAVTLGAVLGVNYHMPGWYKLFQSAVDGFDVIIDSAAGEGFKHFVDLAKPGGRIVFYGGTQGPISTLNPQKIFWKHLSILGTTMGTQNEFASMLAFFEANAVKPVIDELFSMEEAEAAIRRMDHASQFGKLVITNPLFGRKA